MDINKPEVTLKDFIPYLLIIIIPTFLLMLLKLESISGLYFTFGTMIYLIIFLLGKYERGQKW